MINLGQTWEELRWANRDLEETPNPYLWRRLPAPEQTGEVDTGEQVISSVDVGLLNRFEGVEYGPAVSKMSGGLYIRAEGRYGFVSAIRKGFFRRD